MNDNTNHGPKPFPSFSQLLLALPSLNPDYISTKAFRSHIEQGHILDAGVLSQHLSDDIKRFSWLESFLLPYLRDLADARERIAYQKCLLSPIRRVPIEMILQSIFLACLPEGFVEADPQAAPLLLCQIFDTDRGCDPMPDVYSSTTFHAGNLCTCVSATFFTTIISYNPRMRFSQGLSKVLETLELCFPPDSIDDRAHLGFKNLVPMIQWNSSPRLHTLTLNATTSQHVLLILTTCPNIRDCELHVNDENVFVIPEEKLALPHLHTLNIRGRISILNIINAITTPSLRIFTMKGEKRWSQASFQALIDQSSCSIEEFSMVNVDISAEYLLRTLEYIGTTVKVLRLHFYPDRYTTARPISDAVLHGIASYLLAPNLEVLGYGTG
ncbi:uncharacterized protein LACBIDRAFT_328098 [Laccaria bicolor S238N-H82]|uniref:Predicted protein n=1 Tax=Laccaria bicolor (strain S238N-H82 / ATCC MYA-4686) TaxID=486041 RepID=B0DDR8_LACBS|nr:uncharacterized protein LACBIDRAFT_328098 [Laccaria bicolor S238N-H82]EDR07258.1 predicted protein [Laccaria bicolor S238N-H82]|eukprot:XP_001882189.1 predicted protein [Laccaria bicolor S238N-H82]